MRVGTFAGGALELGLTLSLYDNFTTSMHKFQAEMRRLQLSGTAFASSMENMFMGATTGLMAMGAGIVALIPLLRVRRQSINYARRPVPPEIRME